MPGESIEIDGRDGEGGGQIVRTSVALAAITGRPLSVIRVRANRQKPGLQAQHLTAVKAVAEVCAAETEGLRLGAARFRLVPGAIRGGSYHFAVPTAGSAGLVLQAVLPVLLRAPSASEVVFEGGTHVPKAPPYDHLEQVFLPALREMGVTAEIRLERPGFYPKGGGRMVLTVEPWKAPTFFDRTAPPTDWRQWARVYVGKLPEHVERRALSALKAGGFDSDQNPELEASVGPGFVAALALISSEGRVVITAIGEKGTPVEVVVKRAAEKARGYSRKRIPVGPYLADQLLMYLALGGGGRFLTCETTLHFETQVRTLAAFCGERVTVTEEAPDRVQVEVVGDGRDSRS